MGFFNHHIPLHGVDLISILIMASPVNLLSYCAAYAACFHDSIHDVSLLQVLSKDGLCKTYVYGLNVPVAARWISLAVAPFEVFPDCYSGLLSYMCLPAYLSKLRHTVGFFHSAFRYASY